MNKCQIYSILVNDDGDAKILSFNMVPQRAPIGSTISIDYVFATKNGTGTGEIILDISTIDKIPLSTGFLLEAQKPGSYGQRVSLDASPDPDCDPTQGENRRPRYVKMIWKIFLFFSRRM